MASQFYQPELQLPLEIIRRDLVKTCIITVAGILLQFVLFAYLQRGGWSVVLPLLRSISL